MIGLQIDGSDLEREAQHARIFYEQADDALWDEVRRTALEAERQVKLEMPVDTGRARASWGHSTPPAGGSDGIWEEDRAHLSITEGSEVEYIGRLNEGHSRQAPAGFIDAIGVRVQNAFEEDVIEMMVRRWS